MANFGTGEVGSVVQPCPVATEAKPKHWIAIRLLGEDNSPVAWEEYRVELPDKKVVRGYTDPHGYARIDGIEDAGQCMVCFPALDREAWHKI